MSVESISQLEAVAKARYLSLNSRVVHLGDGAIYGICANIVVMEVKHLFPSEGFGDLRVGGIGQVDGAAVPRFALTHAADYRHALIVVVDTLGKRLGPVRLRDFKGEEVVGSGVVKKERKVRDI